MARVARRGRLTDSYVEGLATPGFHRDGVLPGFGIRVGHRRRSFELRIERKGRPKVFQTLGCWPEMKADEARAAAHDILARYERRESIRSPRPDEPTIATLWPLFKKWLQDDGKSRNTIDGYGFAYNRLSDEVKNRPLVDLADDPTIMGDEQNRIREQLSNKKRGGMAAATQSGRLVGALANWAIEKRGLKLSGNPVRGCRTVDPEYEDLPVLVEHEMEDWWRNVQQIPNEVHREALLFTLLSGLRRETVVEMRWQHLDLRRRCIHIPRPKRSNGRSRAFDLVLSRPMIRCLWRARSAGRRLFPKAADTWIFPGPPAHNGRREPIEHVRGDALSTSKSGVFGNHALRRGFSTAAQNAGVDEPTVGRLLNHGGKSVTARYSRSSHLGRMLGAAQEDISAHIVKALGSPRALA
jgi:integrase